MKSNRVMVLCGLAVMLAAWPGVAGANLITNGGFETGSIGPATTGYILYDPASLMPARSYVIGNSPKPYHSVPSDFPPHSGRYMMMVNGATADDVTVWQDTVAGLTPIREKYCDLLAHPDKIREILRDGADRARAIAEKTMVEVKEKMGLL